MTDTTQPRRALLAVLLDRVERGALLDSERPLLRPLVAAEQDDADRAHDYDNRLTWETTCGEHARLLDSCRAAEEHAEEARVEAMATRDGIGQLRDEHEKRRHALIEAIELPDAAGWPRITQAAADLRRAATNETARADRLGTAFRARRHALAAVLGLGPGTVRTWSAITEAVREARADRQDAEQRMRNRYGQLTRILHLASDPSWDDIVTAVRAATIGEQAERAEKAEQERDEAREQVLDARNIHEGARLALSDALGLGPHLTWDDLLTRAATAARRARQHTAEHEKHRLALIAAIELPDAAGWPRIIQAAADLRRAATKATDRAEEAEAARDRARRFLAQRERAIGRVRALAEGEYYGITGRAFLAALDGTPQTPNDAPVAQCRAEYHGTNMPTARCRLANGHNGMHRDAMVDPDGLDWAENAAVYPTDDPCDCGQSDCTECVPVQCATHVDSHDCTDDTTRPYCRESCTACAGVNAVPCPRNGTREGTTQ